jgi:dynactin complex subunit
MKHERKITVSEPMPETATAEAPSETDSAATEFEPITSQEQLDKIVKGFENRYKSKIKDLTEKAAKFDEIEAANKSEAEKQAERIVQLESELYRTLRQQVATAKDVPERFLRGDTIEELMESADELKTFFDELNKPKKGTKSSAGLKSGATGSDSRMDPKERAAAALRAYRTG